jgi:hypothetical protein
MRRITLAATVLAGVTAASAYLVLTAPADAAPACEFGFLTVKKESWILECSKTAPMSQKGVLLTQANNANCKTDSYWNFGPKVTATHLRRNTLVKVNYVCGHAES